MTKLEEKQALINAALGNIESDLCLKDILYLDVFNNIFRKGNISISQGRIVGLDHPRPAHQTLDCRGKWLVPGFIDAHVHIESSLMNPADFAQAVLPHGTTSAICDPHEIANVEGVAGIEYFLNAAEQSPLDLFVMLSSCVPATHMETNGAGVITAEQLAHYKGHSRVLGLAEMMNGPGVLSGDKSCLEKLTLFEGTNIDGHAPTLCGQALSAYIAAGISTCHETTSFDEGLEKIRKGMKVWIREGSVAKDVAALAPLLNSNTIQSLGFCTDDRNPYDIFHEGHVDFLLKKMIALGAQPEHCFRAASFSVAQHYRLTNRGAIAPGYWADCVMLDDVLSVAINRVWLRGRNVSEVSASRVTTPTAFLNSVHVKPLAPIDFVGPEGSVHVIVVNENSLLTDSIVMQNTDLGVARLSVVERHGGFSRPMNAYVYGFGEQFDGAMASSVGHDSHNVTVVGSNELDMATAVNALKQMGGGFVVARRDSVLASLPLPIAGLMSQSSSVEIVRGIDALRAASRSIGCHLNEPFLQLAFLSLPVIPKLKLTDKGLVDVEAFKIIPVRAS